MPMFALAEPEHSALNLLPSTVLHSLLVAAAIAASRAGPLDPIGDQAQVFEITFPVQTTPHTTVDPGVTAIIAAPNIIADPPLELPPVTELPTIPGVRVVDPKALLDPSIVRVGWPGGSDTLTTTATVLSESEVDDPPSLLAAGPLRYPPVLREAGITGSATLAFIIDTDGRVEEQGMEVLAATHPGFVAAATETIRASRFHPAKSHGAAVRVRVRQTISFRQ
jgi:TonB family protein